MKGFGAIGLILALFLLAGQCMAQVQEAPQYVLGAGAGFQTYSDRIVQGWMTAAVRVAERTYSITTVDMTVERASVRTGMGYVLVQQGPWRLIGLGDVGIASGGGHAGGAYSAGGSLFYDISRWTRVDGTYAVGAVRVFGSSVASVRPLFEFGISKTF